MLGAALVLGGGQVAADEPSASNDIKVVVTQTADEDAPTKAQEGTKESITTPATEVSATESKTEEVTPEGTSSSILVIKILSDKAHFPFLKTILIPAHDSRQVIQVGFKL
ncbi:hypothetical protein ACTQ42_09000, partial [Streptococcus alactolyticus]|uniref:hypothetical protein n=1 Tax=Streptococcus alactolyticus TaxID=29389 RepID=UPI003F96A078